MVYNILTPVGSNPGLLDQQVSVKLTWASTSTVVPDVDCIKWIHI